MAGALIRAILSGGAYPVSLLEQTMLRIRAEQTRHLRPGGDSEGLFLAEHSISYSGGGFNRGTE